MTPREHGLLNGKSCRSFEDEHVIWTRRSRVACRKVAFHGPKRLNVWFSYLKNWVVFGGKGAVGGYTIHWQRMILYNSMANGDTVWHAQYIAPYMSGLCLAQGQPLYSRGHSIGPLLVTLQDQRKGRISFRTAALLPLPTYRYNLDIHRYTPR